MKKILLSCSVIVVLVAAVSILASAKSVKSDELDNYTISTHASMEGTHCSGTVGCNCPGFAPITNGDVWQQSYCRHCGHHKRCHH